MVPLEAPRQAAWRVSSGSKTCATALTHTALSLTGYELAQTEVSGHRIDNNFDWTLDLCDCPELSTQWNAPMESEQWQSYFRMSG